MKSRQPFKSTPMGLAMVAAATVAGYAALVLRNRARYGAVKGSAAAGKDSLLDRFLPAPEVVEQHEIDINAPADVVIAAAKELEMLKSPLVRALFKARAVALGAKEDSALRPSRLLDQVQSLGWVVLAEKAGREIVFGSVTRPWEASPTFRSVPASEFRDFAEAGYVKIAWTLRADPVDENRSTFRTETRACTTDRFARRRFRTYWSFVAPGVELIRLSMLRPLKRAAERKRHRAAA